MRNAALSLAQSPPLSVPARFFVTAPLFGVLGALALLWSGSAGLSQRWLPGMLAVTHLLTLGYMTMVMLGALMQVFPVVIGHPFRDARRVAALVHAALSLGTLALAAGFVLPSAGLTAAAVALLGAAALVFAGAAIATLAGVVVWGDTGRAIVLALAAFVVMAALGLWLALGHTPYLALPRAWTDVHAGWALAGWVPLLLMAIAFQVVPMFQVTPPYPRAVRRGFPALLFAMLAASTLGQALAPGHWLSWLAEALAALVLAGFAAATFVLQARRRRRRPDITVAYWRLGLGCLVAAAALWLAAPWLPGARADGHFALALGVLMIPGFAISVINGMLYRIVPFLVWLHLSMGPGAIAGAPVPGVTEIIGAPRARFQLRVHSLALALLLAGVLGVAWMVPLGALALALACASLALDIALALHRYRGRAGPAVAAPGVEGP